MCGVVRHDFRAPQIYLVVAHGRLFFCCIVLQVDNGPVCAVVPAPVEGGARENLPCLACLSNDWRMMQMRTIEITGA
jgi:hypothetical protein